MTLSPALCPSSVWLPPSIPVSNTTLLRADIPELTLALPPSLSVCFKTLSVVKPEKPPADYCLYTSFCPGSDDLTLGPTYLAKCYIIHVKVENK